MTMLFGVGGMKSLLTGAGNFPISVCFPFNRKRTQEYPESVMNALRRPNLRVILLVLICVPTSCLALCAQRDSQIFTVAAAKDNAAQLGSSPVSVRGRFWWGKEGSIVFDSGYKAVLVLQYSDAFNAKHSYHELFPTGKKRKSDVATIAGRLHMEANGRLVLIADDIWFAENPR